MWQPEFIIKQFEFFAENNVKNIKIADELFVLNPNHFMKICDLIMNNGLILTFGHIQELIHVGQSI